MGSDSRRQNSRANTSKAKKNKGRRSKQPPCVAPTSVHDLPDELLDRVFLGLGSSPLHLVRAAATCRRWRRSIADPGFLTRSRAVHGAPPLGGHYYNATPVSTDDDRRCLAPPPLESPPAVFVPASSPAVVHGANFSLDFLYQPPVEEAGYMHRPRYTYRRANRTRARHNPCREIVDSRGSLLLLRNWQEGTIEARHCASDFTVCEPLTRRFQGIARPASLSHLHYLGAFLLDGCGDASMSNFRVLSVHYERDRRRPPQGGGGMIPRACVFAPGGCDDDDDDHGGGWRLCWHPTTEDDVEVTFTALRYQIHFAGRAAGRIYWGVETGDVLVLDEATLQFSLLDLGDEPYGEASSFRVVGGGVDGAAVRVVRMDSRDLQVVCKLPWSGEWAVERSLRLRYAAAGLPGWKSSFFVRPAMIISADETFVVLTPAEKTWLLSVDLDTMELERVHDETNGRVGPAFPCRLPWPPVLRACVDDHHGGVAGNHQRRK